MKEIIISIIRFFSFCFALAFRLCSKVNKNKVLCIANLGKIYGCNPKYITEFLLNNATDFKIYWLFDRHTSISELDPRINVIRPFTLKYIWTINTAGFVINNFRSKFYELSWIKRKSQIYIMTWHGPIPLKKIENDIQSDVYSQYQKTILLDNKYCDLMLSCSTFTTSLIRGAMNYKGEVLEGGVPRNDIFYNYSLFPILRQKISIRYSFPSTKKLVLYAPTFRTNHSTEHYDINWNIVSSSLRRLFSGDDFVILYRIHPDLKVSINIAEENNLAIVNASDYPDMQELLCVSDVLITDYSSTMFEFAILKRPCFIYASDYKDYDRGFYFDIQKLPFPFSSNNKQLCEIIDSFDNAKYKLSVDSFMNNVVGYKEDGSACEKLYKWMCNKS